MFDIGFTELMVIAIVALVVIGPEKLPMVARTVGAYLGRLQRYVNDVKADINREFELDELRKFKQTVEDTARNFESSVQSEASGAEAEMNKLSQAVTDPFADPIAATATTTDAASVPKDGVAPALEPRAADPTPVRASVSAAGLPPTAVPITAAADSAAGPSTADAIAKRAA